MKRNAIVRIILWSTVLLVLLGLFFALLYIPGAGRSLWEDTPPKNSDPITGQYSGTPVRVDAAGIREIEIEWVAGSILIQPTDTAEIIFREENIYGSEKIMQWKNRDNKISIHYAEDETFTLKAGRDWENERKDLIIEVPRDWQCDSMKIAAAAASLKVKDLTVREMEFAVASGDVHFTGSLQQMECDAASADITLELSNIPRNLDMDTASGDLNVTLPADAGFTVSLDTLSGDFESDFDTTMRGSSYVAGDGRCRIDVDAMSGDVTVRKGS